MTPGTSPQLNARQTLGNALRFFREQRKMSQRDLADRVGVSVGDIDDWERGKSAPPDNRWGRLCNMLHRDLGEMRTTWQRARAEEEQTRQQNTVRTAPLTSKPFAALAAVPAPTPAPAPSPVAVLVPETLMDDGFDLRPAYRAVSKLPEGWRTTKAVTERQEYARGLIVEGMTNDDIYKQVRRKFGVGIEITSIVRLREEVLASNRRPKPEPMPTPAPPVPEAAKPVDVEVAASNVLEAGRTGDIEAAVRLVLEAIPNLRSFQIDVDDAGDVNVTHTVREVKIIEKSSSLKLKK